MVSNKSLLLYTARNFVIKHDYNSVTSLMKKRSQFFARQRRYRMVFVFLLLVSTLTSKLHIERSIWVKERSSDFWDYIVNRIFIETDWYENFRMRKETFEYLYNELKAHIEKKNTHLRKSIPAKLRVAVTIWFLSTGTDYRILGHLFGISRSSVCCIVKQVCTSIVKVLLKRYIKFPSGDALEEVVEGFHSHWGFPNCAGAIDGSHIPMAAPVDYHSDYYNRKGWYSMIVQAVADHKYRFLDVYTGWPGSVHDARVFANSPIYMKGIDGKLFPNITRKVDDKDVPIVLLGDSAYPLLPWLMKPFPHTTLSEEQQRYNYCLSRARIVIENAFGRLKSRWRCLMKKLEVKPDNIAIIIMACCILHNVCEIHGEEFDNTWLDGNCETNEIYVQPSSDGEHLNSANVTQNPSSELIRDALIQHFKNN